VITVERVGRGTYVLRATMEIERPPEEIFPFFADAGNLELITPPALHFRIATPRPIRMATGTLIDYTIRIHGIPVSWRTEITDWNPPASFNDTQLRGPYHLWSHTHRFEQTATGGTLCTDEVRYRPRGGALANTLVARDLRAIFAYRAERLRALLTD
jgi:ligand-binding SRPBCC domain-containing protein